MRHGEIVRSARRASLVVLIAVLWGGPAGAEWVRGEVRLNLRTGPGMDRRIVATIGTGDQVAVLDHGEGWTHVRIADGRDGWIPEGYLDAEPPATVRLGRTQTELKALSERLEDTSKETEELRSTNATLTETNKVLTERNRRLDDENRDLKAGARWPEWITGASILAVGMLVGAALQSWSSRRSHSRIRLD